MYWYVLEKYLNLLVPCSLGSCCRLLVVSHDPTTSSALCKDPGMAAGPWRWPGDQQT